MVNTEAYKLSIIKRLLDRDEFWLFQQIEQLLDQEKQELEAQEKDRQALEEILGEPIGLLPEDLDIDGILKEYHSPKLSKVLGQWPGEETYEELLALL
ncbi:MAG: hypothetical protein NW226_05495 [Microscillaceae bacterium]|nr:hypothetical protein [Microscillaceae bacterium]